MKTKKYYVVYGILVVFLIVSAFILNRIKFAEPEMIPMIKGFLLFPVTAMVTSIVSLDYAYALMHVLEKTDKEAYEYHKRTMFMVRFHYSPFYKYRADTKELMEDYHLLCTWVTIGVYVLTIALIII